MQHPQAQAAELPESHCRIWVALFEHQLPHIALLAIFLATMWTFVILLVSVDFASHSVLGTRCALHAHAEFLATRMDSISSAAFQSHCSDLAKQNESAANASDAAMKLLQRSRAYMEQPMVAFMQQQCGSSW